MSKSPAIHCSFCGRNRDEVKILIAGQEGHICENCIEHAHEIIDKEFHQKKVDGKAGDLKVQKLRLKQEILAMEKELGLNE